MPAIRLVKYNRDIPSTRDYTYTLPNMEDFAYDINSPVTPAPLPEEEAADNVLIKVEGNSSVIRVNWRIKDLTSVVFPNTPNFDPVVNSGQFANAITVRSLRDHLLFFRQNFVATGIEDSAAIILNFAENDNLDLTENTIVFNGTFTGFKFHISKSSPTIIDASASFLEGTVIAVHDVDVPTEPLNVDVSVPASGNLVVTWDVPTTEDDITITGYRIRYRRVDVPGDWVNVTISSASARSAQLPRPVSGDYILELSAISSLGDGRRSREAFRV